MPAAYESQQDEDRARERARFQAAQALQQVHRRCCAG